MAKANERIEAVAVSSVIWEQCFREQVCVHIPFDGDQCVGIEACVRLLVDNGHFYVEIVLFGQTIRYEIADTCYPVFEIGIGRLKVCTTNVDVQNGQLKSITLSVQGCVGANIGPIHVEKCWDLYSGTINFFQLSPDDVVALNPAAKSRVKAGRVYSTFVESTGSGNVDPATI